MCSSGNTTVPFLSLSDDEQLMIFMKMGNLEMIRMSQACNSTKRVVEQNGRRLSKRPLSSDEGAKIRIAVQRGAIYFHNQKSTAHKREFNKMENIDFSERIEHFHKRVAAISFDHIELFLSDQDLVLDLLEIVKEWRPTCRSTSVRRLTVKAIEILNAINVRERIILPFPRYFHVLRALQKCESRHCIELRCATSDKYFEEFQHFKKFSASLFKREAECCLNFLWDLYNAENSGNLKEAEFSINNLPLNISRLQDLLPCKQFPPLIKLYSDGDKLFLQKLSLVDGNLVLLKDENFGVPGNRRSKQVTVKVMNDDEQEFLNTLLEAIGIPFYPEDRRAEYFAMDNEKRAEELQSYKKRFARKRKAANN